MQDVGFKVQILAAGAQGFSTWESSVKGAMLIQNAYPMLWRSKLFNPVGSRQGESTRTCDIVKSYCVQEKRTAIKIARPLATAPPAPGPTTKKLAIHENWASSISASHDSLHTIKVRQTSFRSRFLCSASRPSICGDEEACKEQLRHEHSRCCLLGHLQHVG